MSELIDDCARHLTALEESGRLRHRPVFDGGNGRVLCLREKGRRIRLINWASNDYLGALGEITVRNSSTRALRRFGSGSGAARLLSGGLAIHRRLERRLASWHEGEDCCLLTTGYQANLAAITALADSSDDCVIADRLCHASIYDGIALAAGRLHRFAHNDTSDLRRKLEKAHGARRMLVCVESVYSMDGDRAPLGAISDLCSAYGAELLVDEAHAIGVFGPGGRGCCAELGLRPTLLVGTCGKALAAQGGYIVGDSTLVEWVCNRARSFIFSTAPVPAAVGAVLGTLDLLRKRSGMPEMLRKRAGEMRKALRGQGWRVPEGESAIIPVLLGDDASVVALSAALRERGHYAPAIRPPTVPEGSSRLRLTSTLAHKPSDRDRLLRAMAEIYDSGVKAE